MMATFYLCSTCGNLLETITDAGNIPSCCGHPMQKLFPASTDGAKEKHVPVCDINNNILAVNIGESPHPMDDAHYIEWIAVSTSCGFYRKDLCPGDKPMATFLLAESEAPQKIYAYCNLHGLWVTDKIC